MAENPIRAPLAETKETPAQKPQAASALVSELFLRALGLTYLIAFVSFGVQAKGLIGANGIVPIAVTLQSARAYYGTQVYRLLPTVFWFNASDRFIAAVWIAGAILATLLLLGVAKRLACVALFALYLSIVSAGQIFMGYQWDSLLLEAGFLAIFLGWSPVIPWLYRWLLFRLIFMSGAVKLLSGDATWHNLTALSYHYYTQPIPNPLAWYMSQLPLWFHKASTAATLGVELGVPFLFLLPLGRRVRQFAAAAMLALQALILLTGNYAFFNLLTIALCLFLLDDALLQRALPAWLLRALSKAKAKADPSSTGGFEKISSARNLRKAMAGVVTAVILLLSVAGTAERLFGLNSAVIELALEAAAPYNIVNSYGLFAVMTTTRPEIVFEGSADGATWREYEFKYKAGDVMRRPPWIAPHQPRLDWQMWFAALGSYRSDPWIFGFAYRLLKNSPEVARLLASNPFDGAPPPRYIRALVYDYRFTTYRERRESGAWWHRELKGLYLPPLTLDDFQQAP